MITFDDIQGHWVRHWIKAPGFEDHTTHVHWMQVGATYADVRIPADRPDLSGAGALSELPAATLETLTRAEGFAGHVTLEGTHLTWHRVINWHGTPEDPDIGAISFDAEGRMIEAGVHADYTELWEQHPGPNARSLRLTGGGYAGYLMSIGDAFVIGIGTPDKPSTKPALAALASGHIPEQVDQLFDGIHAVGHWAENRAMARLSTQPLCEGEVLATLTATGVVWHRTGFDGGRSDVEMSPRPAGT